MTNIEILSEEKILTIKNNKAEVVKSILESKDNTWIKDFFQEENPFTKSKVQIDSFELLVASNKEEMTQSDLENSILLHKNLKITDSQACDERLWISLCFGKFYDYMKTRWSVERRTNFDEHWLFPHGQKRSLYFNGLSRLYWFAKITYDETLEDPYELTKFCFKDINIVIQMIYRGYSNSKMVRLAIIKAIKEFVEDGGSYNRNILHGILKYVSFLGGAYILDSFSENELKEKCYIKLIELYIQENPNQTTFKL